MLRQNKYYKIVTLWHIHQIFTVVLYSRGMND